MGQYTSRVLKAELTKVPNYEARIDSVFDKYDKAESGVFERKFLRSMIQDVKAMLLTLIQESKCTWYFSTNPLM